MPNWQTRIATQDDLPAIVAIYNSTVPSRMVTADTEPVTVASRQGWFAAHQRPERPLWVVEEEGALLGWLSFSSFYGRPAYDGTAEVSIYLDERARGRGLGRWLLEEAIQRAPKLGLHTLLGFIFGHNEPSLALFARAGFATWGNLPRVAVLDGIERDLLILGLRLPDSN
ncbi:GNAT family N-acetyltransferase [Chitinilyticum aquatile]|uniref:GNAT family N-acetyltransferase n=1 Tax=Chitinilyticum aquatile TaxID=362520 RepID=UPI000407FEE8|nr:GNAT family N-acetyltransferase [Chitinilyticum aquatile]